MLTTLLLTNALAYSTGKTESSITGCTSCHGSSASSSTSVSFTLGASTVAPGDVVDVVFAVTNASQPEAGLDVSATGGTLAAGSNNQLQSSEITHSSPQTLTAGTVEFDFSWTAPTTEGSYTLYGAGNAVNGDGRATAQDRWAITDTTIVVDDGCDDLDGDGYGDTCDEDCDETEPEAWTGRAEICDGVDNDCDASVDESAVDASLWYVDADGDGYGDATATVLACSLPAGASANADDCDDGNAAVNPDGIEVCDPADVDEDCDERADDDDDSVDGRTDWYTDTDGDGYGGEASGSSCEAPTGSVSVPGDCNDTDPATNPGAIEECTDPTDYNCDGSTGYTDADTDGYAACAECNDADAAIYPGAPETCDRSDNNCDGFVDEASAVDATTWFVDSDGDGYGSTETVVACDQPDSSATNNLDCDDSRADVAPGTPEVWYNDVDEACDGGSDHDADADGVDAPSGGGDDCDDTNPAAYPGAPDTPYDGVVTDCNPDDEYDVDLDGAAVDVDCDDTDATVNPDAEEIWYDGVDQDCDQNDDDQDLDGVSVDEDCDDTDAEVGLCGDTGGLLPDAEDPPEAKGACGCANGAGGGLTAVWLLAAAMAARRRRV